MLVSALVQCAADPSQQRLHWRAAAAVAAAALQCISNAPLDLQRNSSCQQLLLYQIFQV
jgi:hypothetical protein